MVFRRLKSMFGGSQGSAREPSPLYGLEEQEREKIGTEADLLEKSVSERFVGSHPYERLASIYESRNPAEALRVCMAFTGLAASGKMPRGAQRSADRKLPEFEARIERYRRSLDTGR